MDTSVVYSETELKDALDSLHKSSLSDIDVDFDCRHIFGYADFPNHSLSMLQRVTATVALDFQNYQKLESTPSLSELEKSAAQFSETHGATLNLQTVIRSTAPRMALAAEFKRASPSKGDIAANLNAGDQAVIYSKAGADIISCLTETRWFKGTLSDLTEIRLRTQDAVAASKERQLRPVVLRKDFVVSKYMIAEAAAAGADTVLLIVAVLPESFLKELIEYCYTLNMVPLVEVHADMELEVALTAGARVIGVNNRNLHTFQLDLSTSERMADQLSVRGMTNLVTLCALSGMSTCYDVDRYRKVGIAMCLIGESLMRAPDPAAAIASLYLDPAVFQNCAADQCANGFFTATTNATAGSGAYTGGTQLIKICGLTNPKDALVACRAGANMIGVIFAEGSKRRVTVKQATDVVQAVRQFGERTDRCNLVDVGTTGLLSDHEPIPRSPIQHLVTSATVLGQATKERPVVVGVFQNQDADFIRAMVDTCGLDIVQLHGNEGMAAANRRNFGVPVIRVVDISVDPATGQAADNAAERILEAITNDPTAILLDTAIKGIKEGGGTGVAFDWSIAGRVQDAGLPVIVAGGLTPNAVKECIQRIRPFGVDVSSGVEKSPGQKDHDKVRTFVQSAKERRRGS